MPESKIEVVNLERGERYDGVDRPLQPFVTAPSLMLTVYADWPFAETEVKRRCLEVLAARAAVPDGVTFVRTWESTPAIVEPLKSARRTAREGRGDGVQRDNTSQFDGFGPHNEIASRDAEAERLASITCKTCHGKLAEDGSCPDCRPKVRRARR